MNDLISRLRKEAENWQACLECIDHEASIELAELLREAAKEIERLITSGAGADE